MGQSTLDDFTNGTVNGNGDYIQGDTNLYENGKKYRVD